MDDNIISFPGNTSQPSDPAPAPGPKEGERISEAGTGAIGIPGLTADQEKAIQLILSGMDFVLVSLKPTDSGADFFTAIDGLPDHLRNALPHLEGVIERLYEKRGL